jgi:tRNA G10  N-methylase Trm11
MMMARRYRGKTNELFTHYLCNLARYSSDLAHRPWETLRLFDPLAGGGTTLFAALMLGASVAGIEQRQKDVQTTTAFIRQFTRQQGISCQEAKANLRGVGRRWTFTLGEEQQTCLVAHGDTANAPELISGFRPHLIVGDLPYGIQHKGQLVDLLENALPIWEILLPPGGALVLAWESRRLPRPEMIELIEASGTLVVLDDPPYNRMAHRVDRVIKRRDVIVARPSAGLAAGLAGEG